MTQVSRRVVLGVPAAALTLTPLALTALTACSKEAPVPSAAGPTRSTYGSDASQFGELHRPQGTPRGVVVVIHGGFWKAQYDLSLGTPLAVSLAAQGWLAWNLEYRRVGNGGGTPATFDDVASGIDHLDTLDLGVELGAVPVVTLGHSAGGHLAAWAANRLRFPQWPGGVAVTHVISQAGVLDLRASARAHLGADAAQALLGHEPTEQDVAYDPAQQVPSEVPTWCVHGRQDAIVPLSQSTDYVAAATARGARAELVEVDGDHFVLIDPQSPAWARTLEILDQLG